VKVNLSLMIGEFMSKSHDRIKCQEGLVGDIVSEAVNEILEKEMDELVDKFKGSLENFIFDNASLIADRAASKVTSKVLEQFRSVIETLIEENIQLGRDNQKLTEEIVDLEREKFTLISDNESFKKELTKLETELEEYHVSRSCG